MDNLVQYNHTFLIQFWSYLLTKRSSKSFEVYPSLTTANLQISLKKVCEVSSLLDFLFTNILLASISD